MLSFVERLIKAPYSLNDLSRYSTAKQRNSPPAEAPFSSTWDSFCVLSTLLRGYSVLTDLDLPAGSYSSIGG